MSHRMSFAIVLVGSLISANAAFAQAGGADVPSDAKAKGTMENGSSSTGMSKGEAGAKTGGSMEKGGSMMKKEGGSMKKSGDKM